MKFMRRLVLGAAAVGLAASTSLALTVGAGSAVARADGPTSEHTVTAIQSKPWVELQEDDHGYRVAAVRCFLHEFGYFHYCNPGAELGDVFTAQLRGAVDEYQDDHGIPITHKVDVETWLALRSDVGVVKPGDDRSSVVKGLQYSLNVLGESTDVDGVYGAKTKAAVKAFQQRKDIGADGVVGPVTFRAMYAEWAKKS